MRGLIFDPFAGISGDMTIAALLDLGLPLEWLQSFVAGLKLGDVRIGAERVSRKGIAANAICRGFIETPILSSIPDKVIKMMEEKVPMGRLGKPEEIANTYAWLASDEASYINGAVIEVSGGCTI